MRNATLHGLLEDFTTEASMRLSLASADGEEIPFEVVESTDRARFGRVPLYCYRPLTAAFIRERLGLLAALPTYAPAVRALEAAEGTDAYLVAVGEDRVAERPRDRADAALRCFLARVFEDRSEFGFDPDRFERAYDELERALYQGRCLFEVVAPLLGVALDPDTTEFVIGDGISLLRCDALADPPDAIWEAAAGDGARRNDVAPVVVLLRVAQDRNERSPVWMARTRFRRILTALRLFEHGGYALGPIGWTRIDHGAWRPVALGASGRPRMATLIPAAHEDELRAFCNLIGRRLPSPASRAVDSSGAGEIVWALARYEMGCERLAPFEALTDYLMALRALLEPEGPSSGRLAQRLSVICARPEDRVALAERTAHAISLERAVIAGIGPAGDPDRPADALVDEMAEHLRAILRDALCGHLSVDLRGVADDLLTEAAAADSPAPVRAPAPL